MAREQKYVTQLNDYGHKIRMELAQPDGSVYPIPDGATVTFQAYLHGTTELVIEDTAHVTIEDQDKGIVYYTTQQNDITTAGVYWCRFKVNNIKSFEAKWTLKPEFPNGE